MKIELKLIWTREYLARNEIKGSMTPELPCVLNKLDAWGLSYWKSPSLQKIEK